MPGEKKSCLSLQKTAGILQNIEIQLPMEDDLPESLPPRPTIHAITSPEDYGEKVADKLPEVLPSSINLIMPGPPQESPSPEKTRVSVPLPEPSQERSPLSGPSWEGQPVCLHNIGDGKNLMPKKNMRRNVSDIEREIENSSQRAASLRQQKAEVERQLAEKIRQLEEEMVLLQKYQQELDAIHYFCAN